GEVVEAYFDELVPLDRIQAAGELFPEGVALRDAKEVWHGFPSASLNTCSSAFTSSAWRMRSAGSVRLKSSCQR
ncbi:MAG: hypothetical protein M3Y40_00440, partial [Chloroflexota bacterium]|nr:hypothetical protein [Chloroflexota bacterium]